MTSDLRLDASIDTRLDVDGQKGDCIERLHTLKGVDDLDGPMAHTKATS
jgi:hypothetical protein